MLYFWHRAILQYSIAQKLSSGEQQWLLISLQEPILIRNGDCDADEEELDFEGFMRLLKADKVQNLAYFESRLPASREASQSGQAAEVFTSSLYKPGTSPILPPVAED